MIQQTDNQKRQRRQVGAGKCAQYHMPLQILQLNKVTIVDLLNWLYKIRNRIRPTKQKWQYHTLRRYQAKALSFIATKWWSHFGKQFSAFLKKIKSSLSLNFRLLSRIMFQGYLDKWLSLNLGNETHKVNLSLLQYEKNASVKVKQRNPKTLKWSLYHKRKSC